MRRREFMRSAALFGGLLIPVGRQAWAAGIPDAPATERKLIVIMLRGAVDGLSVVVPH